MALIFLSSDPDLSVTDELQALVSEIGQPWDQDRTRRRLEHLRLATAADALFYPLWEDLGRGWAQQGDLRPFVLLASVFPLASPALGQKERPRPVDALVDEALKMAIAQDDVPLWDLLSSPVLSAPDQGPWIWQLMEAVIQPRLPEQVLARLLAPWNSAPAWHRKDAYRALIETPLDPAQTFAGLAVLRARLPVFWEAEEVTAQALVAQGVEEGNWTPHEVLAAGPPLGRLDALLSLLHVPQEGREAPAKARLWALTDALLEHGELPLQRQWLQAHGQRLPHTQERVRAAERQAMLALRPAPATPSNRRRS